MARIFEAGIDFGIDADIRTTVRGASKSGIAASLPPPEEEDFPDRLTAQPLAKHFSDPLQFLGGEGTKPPH
jgi:hypothetical protein